MADDSWTVQDANAQLSEVLRRARAGEPQRIGMTDEACIVISAKTWEALHPSALGAWLVVVGSRVRQDESRLGWLSGFRTRIDARRD